MATNKFASTLACLALLVALSGVPAEGQEKVIHRFTGQPSDGYFPVGDLIADSKGNLFGTTYAGGTFNQGTVFQLIRPATPNGGWRENVLYSFTGVADGANPLGGLVFDTKGNLFGTTSNGGAGSFPGGTIYELSPPATTGGSWTETTLFDFTTGNTAVGLNPQGTMAMDAAGNLFGVAGAGGNGAAGSCGDTGCGTAFELQPPSVAGGNWTIIDIHDFLATIPDGIAPNSIMLGPGGVLYGTTINGGSGGGIVFKLIPPASGGAWTEKILYTFTGNQGNGDGYLPNSVTPDKNGGLFGTTQKGGVSSTGYGVVFHLTYSGTGWTESILYTFTGGTDGASPKGGVLVDSSGNLYGTTNSGGSSPCTANGGSGCGTVFKLTPPTSGGAWMLTTLYDFVGGIDGVFPIGNLWLEKGVYYGATANGGSSTNTGLGTVFRVAP